MIENVAVISIWAPDVPKTAHFYRDVLGLELIPHLHAGQPHFRIGEVLLTILKGTPQPVEDPEPSRFPVFALRARNFDQAVARLEEHGVDLPWGIEGEGKSRWVMFFDPAGNLIEIT
jgi:catechol 2,3-dioxygenase-like lactoylglutathione lyase family enzyme